MEKMNEEQLKTLLCRDYWSNAACAGYLIMACRQYGLSNLQTNEMLQTVKALFDAFSVEQAASIYTHY